MADQWRVSTLVPGYSDGLAPDSHRLPAALPFWSAAPGQSGRRTPFTRIRGSIYTRIRRAVKRTDAAGGRGQDDGAIG